MAKKAAAKKPAAKKAETCCDEAHEILVVGSKVKAYLKSKDVLVSGEMIPAVSCKVACLLGKAVERCKANGRKTVKPCDL
ncbi:MAG TPA: hypothetical protein PL033_09570 [Candidatus Brocadiia bacterium]|nr:hypothetical protein [Candidatus Brocadiia bacterium]